MNKIEFLQNLQDILQTDKELSFDTNLCELQEWDSLSKITTLAFLDREFGILISVNEIDCFKTIEDIAKKCGL